jgi:hypothetical protein
LDKGDALHREKYLKFYHGRMFLRKRLKKPSHATDSELTDYDVIIRYEGDVIL